VICRAETTPGSLNSCAISQKLIITVKHIIFIYSKFNKKDQWARSIFDMLYLPWPDQKVITDRKKPNWDYWENAKVKCNKRVIINISEIRIYLWRVIGVGYGPDSPSCRVLNR
jgi:hypothetical protein